MADSDAPSNERILNYSIDAIRNGNIESGRRGLHSVLVKDPKNVKALLWFAYVTDDRSLKVSQYKHILELDPANVTARKALEKYGPSPIGVRRVRPEVFAHAKAASDVQKPDRPQLAPLEQSRDTAASKLSQARQDLLDLSLFNRLLNYRVLKGKGLEIINGLPADTYRSLVVEGRPATFKPERTGEPRSAEEVADAEGEEPPETHVKGNNSKGDDLRSAGKLQTPYTPDMLQKRLLSTYYAARTYVEEQGVNTLFLALGMLEWYEAPSSETSREAPLILVPVELTRSNVRAKFRLDYTGEEIGENLSLRAKLASEFGITLPGFPEEEDFDLQAYFDGVERALKGQPKWRVNSQAMGLGFFSFGKFLMFNDLDSTHWPEGLHPPDHPILSALLGDGFKGDTSSIGEEADVDALILPEHAHHVVDADSSQTIAIDEVTKGKNLVIQGPPGTGKSQTIANIIGEAIGHQKTVLFVAEKNAALEVVKRRLDLVGLGDACLELHSNKTNKKALLEELKRSLGQGQPKIGDDSESSELGNCRTRLNEYCRAVNEQIGESGFTPYDVMGELLRLEEALAGISLPNTRLQGLDKWSKRQFEEAQSIVEELEVLLQRIGLPVDHVFWGSELSLLLPETQEMLAASLRTASSSLAELGRVATSVSDRIHLPSPRTMSHLTGLSVFLKVLLGAPSLEGVNVASEKWSSASQQLSGVLAAGQELRLLSDAYSHILRREAWAENVEDLRAVIAGYGPWWWRRLSSPYRAARKTLASLCEGPCPRNTKAQLELLDAIVESQELRPLIESFGRTGHEMFGNAWAGESSDWKHLADVANWIARLRGVIRAQELPHQVIDFLSASPNVLKLKEDFATLGEASTEYLQALEGVAKALCFNESRRFGPGKHLVDLPFEAQERLLRLWLIQLGRLHEIIILTELVSRLGKLGLRALADTATTWPDAPHHLVELLMQTRLTALLQRAMTERPVLARFDGDTHTHFVNKFCGLDQGLLHRNRIQLALAHWRSTPRHQAGGQLGLLRREFEKKRRHKPIRRLIAEAGSVIQAIKPVFMMSPLSIANYLPPGSVQFDLVVFDEASQVKPVDAFGSIVRGRQAVVVGDDRQLPPTSFFETEIDIDEDFAEDLPGDLESILGLCVAQGMPQRMLRWHYRSRHESLIAVSNHEFYDDKLTIFPSPDKEKQAVGLVYHYLPDTAYGRSGTRKNTDEARKVAESVIQHANRSASLSLGVAAFSLSQVEAIRDQVELQRRLNPSSEPFFRAHPEEPFFVKNLENVQGDERDVIFISVGYGRTVEGKVSLNFGPLNSDGGERRLNVLITRARERCEIFTNLRADDIDLAKTKSRGVEVLKRYLKYADTGSMELPSPSEREIGSPFEEAVVLQLRRLGHRVDCQVGTGGFYIDLAVVDERNPGRYLLGIECDGASYHSARSARDRDRLRQEVLENLGWKLHRIWSTDWFRNRDREIKRLTESIEAAHLTSPRRGMRGANEASPTADGQTAIPREEAEAEIEGRDDVDAYVWAKLRIGGHRDTLHEVPARNMAAWIQQVVSVESPVHQEEVIRRIADAAGVKRIGKRIMAAYEAGIQAAVKGKMVKKNGKFLWRPEPHAVKIRSRTAFPIPVRRLGLIAPEEIEVAITHVAAASFGIERGSVAREVCRKFGFVRGTEGVTKLVDSVVRRMLKQGALVERGEYLTIPD